MARLPTTLGSVAPRGARPSGYVAVSKIGEAVEDVGEAVAKIGQAQMARDDTRAQKALLAAQAEYEPKFGERAAGYDGRTSGFAAAETATFDDHFKTVLADPKLSDGVRFAMRKRVDAYKADVGRRAIGVETEKRAGIVADQERVKVEARTGQALVGFNTAFSGRYQARVDDYDGSDPQFAPGVLADFDAEAKTALEAAPADIRPRLEASFAARRVQVHAQALEAQDKGHDAFVADNAKKTVSALANNVLSNPAAYGQTLQDLESAAAGVPRALRRDFLDAAQGELAGARIEGLLAKDDAAQARAELADGRYDKLLQPGRKAALMARVEAAETAGPRTLEDWRRAYEADGALAAEVEARSRGRTTGFSLQSIAEAFSPREQAAAERKLKEADQVFAATGNLTTQTTTALRERAIAPPPDPAAPDYAAKQRMWELTRKAAAAELAQREKDPAAWAMASDREGDTGAAVQAALKTYLEAADPAERARAGTRYASLSLGRQEFVGMAPTSMRMFGKDQAADLVRSFSAAAPDAKGKALVALTGAVQGLPTAMRLQDGRTINPRAMAMRELRAQGLGMADVSAMTDLADHPGRLELYGEATADPNALKPLPGQGHEAALQALVDSRLSRFFATADALPGSPEQNAGRQARARILARHLMQAKGMSPRDAAEAATADLVDGYRFVDGWRMPRSVAEAPGLGVIGDRGRNVRAGAARVVGDLTERNGELAGELLSPAPGGAGLTDAARRAKAADIVEAHGRWVTTEDDAGLQLMVPTERGWTPVPDRHGRAVRLTWDQLAKAGVAGPQHKPGDWMAPAPAAALPPRAPPARARAAFAGALEQQESGGHAAAVSPKGALGVRQLIVPTAREQATRDGLKVFDGKSDAEVGALLLADPALNRRISDNHIDWLAHRYDGNVGLIAAAYNAGPGAVDGWLRTIGDPRRGRLSLDEWVDHIPYKETRDYVRAVLPGAMARLMPQAGPG